MATSLRLIRVFLASPGDLSEERRAAKGVVEEFNAEWSKHLTCMIELVGWEDTVSVFGRPQEIINKELESCELFVGLLWKKWGSKPSVRGPFTSGFQEEFQLSVQRRQESGAPEISLFFKEIDEDLLTDPGPGLKRVIEFRAKVTDEKTLLFQTFADVREFEAKFRRCITQYVQGLIAQDEEEAGRAAKERPSTPSRNADTSGSLADRPAPSVVWGAKFLGDIAEKFQTDAESITPADVARLRLLAEVSRKTGNDEDVLGVHDANILYSNKNTLDLDRREAGGLIKCGLGHLRSENVPIWHWVHVRKTHEEVGPLAVFSLIGTDDVQAGALLAMKKAAEPLPSRGLPDRETILSFWFADTTPDNVKVAALAYLGDCGLEHDLSVVQAEVNRSDPQTERSAVGALVRLLLKYRPEEAFAAVVENDLDSFPMRLVDQVAQMAPTVSIDLLERALLHRSVAVRLVAMQELSSREWFDDARVEALLEDPSAQIRYEALVLLQSAGKEISLPKARSILVKRRGQGLLGSVNVQGKRFFKKLKKKVISQLDDDQLKECIKNSTPFDLIAYFVLAERHYEKCRDDLASEIDNRFEEFIGKRIANFGVQLSVRDLSSAFDGHTEDMRNEATRDALELVCAKGRRNDLKLVRRTLKRGGIASSHFDFEYLAKHGELKDVPLIVGHLSNPDIDASSIFDDLRDDKYRLAAASILKIGRGKLDQLLPLCGKQKLLKFVILQASKAEFLNLTDLDVSILFNCEYDDVRKAACLKSIVTLPKSRLEILLATYLAGERNRYYNVIHWLDLGVSFSRRQAEFMAKAEMREMLEV